MGRGTQGDYRLSNKIAGSKKRLKQLLSSDVFQILEKYEKAMVMDSLADASKAKNFDTILGLTRLLPDNKSWLELDRDDVEDIVVSIMNKYGENGKESSVTNDFKRFLKIWFRFIKLGSRSFKKVGDPIETRDIVSKNVETKVVRLQLITSKEKKKLVDACTTLRDKALIDTHYDAGTRIGEILSLQIKHVKVVSNGVILSVDGKTGARPIMVLECLPTLSLWLESHPEKGNPEAYLFPNMKHIWKGNKLSYAGSVRVLKTACKDAKIRPVNWHLFRHTEATRAAKTMPESLLKKRHGWSANSKMSARYSHVSNEDANNAYLKAHGIQPKEEHQENTAPIMCPICKTANNYDTTMCMRCMKPLTTDMAILLESDSTKKQQEQSKKIESLEKQNQENQLMMKALLEGQQRLENQLSKNTDSQNEEILRIGTSDKPLINEVWGMIPPEIRESMTQPPINEKIVSTRQKVSLIKN